MSTIENSSGYGFGAMLRHELSSPLLWLLAGLIMGLTWFVGQTGMFGVALLVLLCLSVAGISAHLVQRTPWCSDTAFWRTRPISRRMLFLVKSVAIFLLCVVPLLCVAVVGMMGFDRPTATAVLVLATAGVIGIAVSAASAVVIGSLDGRWKSAGWQAVFTAPMVSSVILMFVRNYLPLSTPQGPGEGVSALMVGFSIAGVGGLVAWFVGGLGGKAKAAFWILLGTGILWPWIAFTSRTDFFKVPESPAVSLKLERAVSVLRVPGDGLIEVHDEWFVPSRISTSWRDPSKEDSISRGLVGHAVGRNLPPNSEAEVFSKNHRDFSSVVDVEKLWEVLRSTLPAHQHWVPSERADQELHSNFKMPPAEAFAPGAAGIEMEGSLFRFHPMAPVLPGVAHLEASSRERLDIVSVGVPNKHSIGVNLRMRGPILGQSRYRLSLSAFDPPEVWGILFHAETGTAYGSASLRGRNSTDGLSKLVIWSNDLQLRFELPRLESALLDLDPERLIAESVLYLFVVEKVDRATVKFPAITR